MTKTSKTPEKKLPKPPTKDLPSISAKETTIIKSLLAIAYTLSPAARKKLLANLVK